MTGNGSAAPGGVVTVTATVANRGSAPAAPCTLGLYVSEDKVLAESDILLSRQPLAGLEAGASQTLTVVTSVPMSVAPGAYYFGALADVDGAVVESSEADNALVGQKLNVRRPKN